MVQNIKKLTLGDNCKIDFIEQLNLDGNHSEAIHSVTYKENPHKDFYEAVHNLVNFFNIINSQEITVSVPKDDVSKYRNRHLGKRVLRKWHEDFIDEDTGETVTIDRNEILYDVGTFIDSEVILGLKESTEANLNIYKENVDLWSPTDVSIFYNLKSIEYKLCKETGDLESVKCTFLCEDKTPFITEKDCQYTTSNILIGINHHVPIYNKIKDRLLELIESLNFEIKAYMTGKNAMPKQMKLFDAEDEDAVKLEQEDLKTVSA